MIDQDPASQTTGPQATPPRRASVLHSIVSGSQARKSSPEAPRRSLLFLIALTGTGVAGYYLAVTQGTGLARQVLAVILAGWLAMCVHIFRSVPKNTRE